MNTNHHSDSGQAPVDGQGIPSNKEIFESTKQMIGGLAPQLSFGVAQREAVLRASMAGATPEYERCPATTKAERRRQLKLTPEAGDFAGVKRGAD